MELAVQKAIYDALVAAGMTVRDDVPMPDDAADSADFPYVTVGDATYEPFDTDDSIGADAVAEVHAWSRYAGRKEVKELQEQIYNALHHVALNVAGFHLLTCDFISSETSLEDDGKTRSGVSRFRVLIDETA